MSKDTDKEHDKASEKGRHSSDNSKNEDFNPLSCTILNKQLDIVGTPTTLNQIQNATEIKKNLFPFVFQSLEQRNNTPTDGKKCNDYADETSSSDNTQFIEKDNAVERNALEVESEDFKGGGVSGCPIPSFTSARSYQKSDWKDKKQLEVSKGKFGENLRNVSNTLYCQNTRPAFQTEVYRQPAVDKDSGSEACLGQFFQNSQGTQFRSEFAYGKKHTVSVNRHTVPGAAMPVPNVLMPSVHGPSVPVSVHPSNQLFMSESHMSADGGQHVTYIQPIVQALFKQPPPPLVSVHAPSAANSTMDSDAILQNTVPMTSSTCRPNVEHVAVEGSRDHSVKTSEIDVISWFAKREAAEKNPTKKNVIDWFSDIIDKKRNASLIADLEPEIKKARLDFIDSLNLKRNSMCESKDKVNDSSSRISRKMSPSESRDAGSKDSLKRRSTSGSSHDTSAHKKPKIDAGKVSFTIGQSSDGFSKRRGPLMKSVDLDSQSDSEEICQKSSSQKSRIDSERIQSIFSEVFSKIALDMKKDSRAHDSDKPQKGKNASSHNTDKAHLESKPHIADQTDGETFLEASSSERKKEMHSRWDQAKPMAKKAASSSKRRKRMHSRWDQAEPMANKLSEQHKVTSQYSGTDDNDMNVYAHALLEGDSSIGNLETISNRISDSILKSMSSSPKSSKTSANKSSIRRSSAVADKPSSGQTVPKLGKSKSNLTDKPLEFLLFAKEMIMQKLQEEEQTEQVDIEPRVDTDIHSLQKDPVFCQETRLSSRSDANHSPQMTSGRYGSDLDYVKSKEEESKEDQSRKEYAKVVQNLAHTSHCVPSLSPTEEVSVEKGSVFCSSASAGVEKIMSIVLQGNAERKSAGGSVSTETQKKYENIPTALALDAFSKAEITEEEINKLKNIICQLTRLPVSNPSDQQLTCSSDSTAGSSDSTSAKKKKSPTVSVLSTCAISDKSGTSIGGNESKCESSSVQEKNMQMDRSRTQGSTPTRNSSTRWNWNLFLAPQPSMRRLMDSTFGRKNYTRNDIDPPFASRHESKHWQLPQNSAREASSGSSAHLARDFSSSSCSEAYLASKQSNQREFIMPETVHMRRQDFPQTSYFPASSGPVQRELSAKHKLPERTDSVYSDYKAAGGQKHPVIENICAAKAKNSAQAQAPWVSSSDSVKHSARLKSVIQTVTSNTKTPQHSESAVLPSSLVSVDVSSPQQKVEFGAAKLPTTSAHEEVGSVEMISPPSTSLVSSHGTKSKDSLHGHPETKTLKDFLTEHFPDKDPVLLVNVLDYKLTMDVNTMSNKMKKSILYKIRSHMDFIYPVSKHPVSSTPATTLSVAPPSVPLEEFALDQIELELRLVEGCLKLMEATEAIQKMPDQTLSTPSGHSLRDWLHIDSPDRVKASLSVVVSDFHNTIRDGHRGWKGRPHQRIPNALLLCDEQNHLYTKEGVFTMLLVSIPCKPFTRLLEFKQDIEKCSSVKNKDSLTNKSFVVMQERRIEQIHNQRAQMLRTFTGAVSANRLRRVKTLQDHYDTTHHHLLQVLGEGSVAKMGFFRATLWAIQHHLQILENEMK